MRRTPLGIALGISLLPVVPAQASWVPSAGAVAPPSRNAHGLAPGPGNTIVLCGGCSMVSCFGDTWILDGAGWRQATTAVAPQARGGHGMAFDMVRGRVVLFGGLSPSGWLDDTWEWDGAAWLLRSASVRPTRRSECSMNFDPLRGTTVLFGGRDGTSGGGLVPVGDTWEWDGLAWAQRSTPIAPPARYGSAMAFDLASLRMLLFGGNTLNALLADTWVYDGASWQMPNSAHSPSPRVGSAIASDWQRTRVVLFGGTSNLGTPYADTWEWDGADWVQRVPAMSPPGRSRAAQVLDLARNRIILFGGLSPSLSTVVGDTWEYCTTAVPSVTTLAPGCAGSGGTPVLATLQWPWLGDVLQFVVDPTPPGAPALLALGLSSTTWGTLSLPASLASFGMPGCALAVSVDAAFPMTGAIPSCTLTLPANNAFAGLSLFAQALVVDATANAAGCVLSSALALQLGAR